MTGMTSVPRTPLLLVGDGRNPGSLFPLPQEDVRGYGCEQRVLRCAIVTRNICSLDRQSLILIVTFFCWGLGLGIQLRYDSLCTGGQAGGNALW